LQRSFKVQQRERLERANRRWKERQEMRLLLLEQQVGALLSVYIRPDLRSGSF
jgi:hypothetical protein